MRTIISRVLTFSLFSKMGNAAASPALTKGTTIFDFKVPAALSNGDVSLDTYKGKKAYLLVNVACQCGLTDSNYRELQQLYSKYEGRGLEILAFPCNNFMGQEPGSAEEIKSFTNMMGVTFPVLGKLECDNGSKTHPLYQYLKNSLPGGILGNGLKWNFAKFLVNKQGIPVKRYGPTTSPLSISTDIEELIETCDTNPTPESSSS